MRGKLLNTSRYGFKINGEVLTAAGYRQVPSHVDAVHQYDEEWISNTNNFGKSQFPRFHIIKERSRWWLHYDQKFNHNYYDGNIIFSGPLLSAEKGRLHEISNALYRQKTVDKLVDKVVRKEYTTNIELKVPTANNI